jgi:hypothetical protein
MTFGQSVALLVVTAVLTGLLVPIVKGFVDDRKLKKQKAFDDERLRAQREFEADLARQASVIDAQVQLLDELAKVLWGYQKLLLRITYYAVTGNREKHEAAYSAYDDQSWELLEKILGLTSKTRRLASKEIQARLENLYQSFVLGVDHEVLNIRAADSRAEGLDHPRWRKLQDVLFGEVRDEIDGILTALATQLRLSGQAAPRGKGSNTTA